MRAATQITWVNCAPGRTLTFSCVSICAADGNFAVKGSDYGLVVRGELDQRFAYLFNGMGMKRREGMTVMEGHVRDQAQLHGLIERTQCLGLELISVERIAEAPEKLR